MPALFDSVAFGLPGNPLELISLVLILDALAVAGLALLDVVQTRRSRHAH